MKIHGVGDPDHQYQGGQSSCSGPAGLPSQMPIRQDATQMDEDDNDDEEEKEEEEDVEEVVKRGFTRDGTRSR